MVFLQVVEVHVLDLDVLILFEQFLTSWNVVAIDVNTQNLSVFEAVNDTFERMSGCGSDVEDFFDRAA